MNEYKYKVFIISLKTAAARRENLVASLKKWNMDYEIIDAVFGRDIQNNDPEIDWEWANNNSYWVSRGALGCSLSHKAAYRAVAEQQLDYALVLEDDTVLYDDVPVILKKIGACLQNKEVILLYYASHRLCRLTEKNCVALGVKNYRLLSAVNPDQLLTANAYVISARACAGILAYQTPVKATADMWFTFNINHAIEKVRCVYPMLAEAADYKSTIDYIPDHTIKGRLLSIIDNYRIFPFYDVLRTIRKNRRMASLNFEIVSGE